MAEFSRKRVTDEVVSTPTPKRGIDNRASRIVTRGDGGYCTSDASDANRRKAVVIGAVTELAVGVSTPTLNSLLPNAARVTATCVERVSIQNAQRQVIWIC